jgi:hypothetical protein
LSSSLVASKASTLSTHVHLAEEQQPVASGSGSGSASANGRAADDAKPASGADDVDEAPEDDFNAAWEVLDAARTLFSKMEGDEARLSEAECFLTLGDVSLETGASPPSKCPRTTLPRHAATD